MSSFITYQEKDQSVIDPYISSNPYNCMKIKTFEEACSIIRKDDPFYLEYITNLAYDDVSKDLIAFLKLRIITKVLNDGWIPDFSNREQLKWMPWFEIKSSEKKEKKSLLFGGLANCGSIAGFLCATSTYVPSYSYSRVGSRLCFKSEELAEYCGRQFIDLWKDLFIYD